MLACVSMRMAGGKIYLEDAQILCYVLFSRGCRRTVCVAGPKSGSACALPPLRRGPPGSIVTVGFRSRALPEGGI